MAVNKVVYDGDTLVDLTGDTVTADSLVVGTTAHDKSGAAISGNNPYAKAATDTEIATQESLIAQIAAALEGKAAGGGSAPQEPQMEIYVTTTKLNSNNQTISFGGLPGEPKMFAVIPTGNITLGSTRYVTSVVNDGSMTHGIYGYRASSSATAYHSSSYFTPTYSNGTLSIKTSSTSNGGYFSSSVTYKLVAIC